MSERHTTTKYSGVLREISAAAAANLDERGVPLHLGRLQRKVALAGYDKESRTVSMAASSDTPVDRYYGIEILSHDAAAVDLSRVKQGVAPMLFNHDYDQHLGRIQTAELDGGTLRLKASFAGNPLAREKEGDVDTGDLVAVSIGYVVTEWDIVENAKTGKRTYTATQWELLEVSLVTVPADPTVGIGRSSDPAPNVRSFRTVDDAGEDVRSEEDDDEDDDDNPDDEAERSAAKPSSEPAPPNPATPIPEAQRTATMADTAVVEVVATPAEVEATRVAGLQTLHRDYPKFFGADALAAARALDMTLADAKRTVADKVIANAQKDDIPTVADEVLGRMSEREASRYSIGEAYRMAAGIKAADGDPAAGFVREVSDSLRAEAAKRGFSGIGQGIIIPSATSRALATTRTIASGGNAGTATNFTTVAVDPIELLRFRTAVLALGATNMPNLQGTFQMPRQTGSATSSWVPEASTVTSSDPTYDSITMAPKPLMIQNSYYRNFFAQSRLAIESELSKDRMAVLARSLDSAAIAGVGTGVIPLGLLARTGLAAVLAGSSRASNGTFTAGAGGVPMSYQDFVAMETAIATANADLSTLGWLTTTKVRGAARGTLKAASASSDFIWPDFKIGVGSEGVQPGPLGYAALATTNPVLTGFTANSVNNLHACILGVWAQILIGDWGLSELITDPYTGASSQKVIITENAFYDVQVRHLESFAACTSALAS